MARNHGETLSTAQAFASLSLFTLLSTPVDQFIQSLPALGSALACFSRIHIFLVGASRKDYRRLPGPESRFNNYSSPGNSSVKLSEKKTVTVEVQCLDSDEVLSIKNSMFSWKEDLEPVLRDINIVIRRSTLNLIVGPVGCGKSSLLSAVLGEMPYSDCTFQMSSADVAYCSQSPWITNGTIQENVLGSCIFDRDWYATVLHACVLDQDFRTFASGDQTSTGSKGLKMSGGQKQRLVGIHLVLV